MPLGPEWPSCYFHDKLKLFLVIYVDDFKLSGPKESLAIGWELLKKKLLLEKPKSIDGESYLGCRNRRFEMTLPGGGVATAHEYDMEDFMRSCVQLYEELAPGVRLKTVPTPFLNDDHRDSAARGPIGTGPVQICPWCECPTHRTAGLQWRPLTKTLLDDASSWRQRRLLSWTLLFGADLPPSRRAS